MTTLILDDAEQGIAALFDRLRRRAVCAEAIFIDLLAPVARNLGQMWADDDCDFATVTVGVARLQRLMREFGIDFAPPQPDQTRANSILLAQPPDEQHGLGVAIVAEFFRRDDWAVEMLLGPHAEDPASRAQADWFDVVGFSIGSETRLAWLRFHIDAVRLASRNTAVVIMVGGPLFQANPGWAEHLGADAWAVDAKQAPALAHECMQNAPRAIAQRVPRSPRQDRSTSSSIAASPAVEAD